MKKVYLLSFFLVFSMCIQAQDTLSVMYYNVLRFPSGSTVNRVDTLRKVFQYYKPDVLLICELESVSGANSILNNALNVAGTSSYARANFVSNTSGSDNSHNMLFYNSSKLSLLSQDEVQTDVRDINEYNLYYSAADFMINPDTIYFDFFAAHLKAGNSSENASIRKFEVDQLKAHLEGADPNRNIFFGGDFNIYRSSEAAYITLLDSGSVRFNDPINTPGNWNNSSSYASIHTQSTRTVSIDGGATGGLDDRFDFILTTGNILNGSNDVQYIPGTYKAAGNDGAHFNQDLITGSNSAAPDSVISALYYASDHLPIMMQIEVFAVPDTTPVPVGNCDELFFSEYIEGSSNNKAYEIYNPGSTSVSLNNYSVRLYSNGSPTPSNTQLFGGSLAAGETYLVANDAAASQLLNEADLLSSTTFYNGNDALELYNGGTLIDLIGQKGSDPGSGGWTVGSGSTSEHTLVRKTNVQEGTDNWVQGALQWDVYPQDYFADFGQHNMDPCVSISCSVSATVQNLQALVAPNGTNVALSWDALPDALVYQAKGRRLGTVPFGQFVTANTMKNIGGLLPGTSYEWRVRAQCSNEEISAFSPFDVFTTASPKLSKADLNDFKLFPSPASSMIHLSIPSLSDEVIYYSLVALDGRMEAEGTFGLSPFGNSYEIDISKLDEGIHIIRINTGSRLMSRPFMVIKEE